MRLRSSVHRWSCLLAMVTAAVAAPTTPAAEPSAQKPPEKKKPSISLRANPTAGFSPLRVVVTAEVKGGSDDYEDFYCASVEWDWGDDTKSQNNADCDPYEPGKSEIKRRYVQEHTFRSMVERHARGRRHADRPATVPYPLRAEAEKQGRRVGSDGRRNPVRYGQLVSSGGLRPPDPLTRFRLRQGYGETAPERLRREGGRSRGPQRPAPLAWLTRFCSFALFVRSR